MSTAGPGRLVTRTGVGDCVAVRTGSPSCARLLPPQQKTSPPRRRAHVWLAPSASATGGSTTTGASVPVSPASTKGRGALMGLMPQLVTRDDGAHGEIFSVFVRHTVDKRTSKRRPAL